MANKTGLYYYTKEEIDEKIDYATSEVACGTWIDGKTIYRKTINFGALPSSASAGRYVPHGISGLNKVIKIEGYATYGGEYYPIPLMYRGGDSQFNVQCFVNSTNVIMTTTNDRSNYTAYVTIYYTKS